jgi:hypothetical protein
MILVGQSKHGIVTEKGDATYLEERTSVIISVVNAHGTAVDGNVDADGEVLGHECGSICSKNNLAFQEGALGNTSVNLLGLGDHDWLVFEVVANDHLSDSHVFETALDDALLEVGVESQDL